MALFPALSAALREFASGFEHQAKATGWNALADNAPLEKKSGTFEDGWFGTGDGQLTAMGNGFRRWQGLAGGIGYANEPVTLDTAQNLSTVHACRRILCETTASLPFFMAQRTSEDQIKLRTDLPVHTVMTRGNSERSGFGLREVMMGHLVFQGNAYARVIRRSGKQKTALDLKMLLPEWVIPSREFGSAYGRLRYDVTVPGTPRETFFVNEGEPQDILHIRGYGYDGLKGYSLLNLARQSFSSGIGMDKNWGRFLANGGRQPYLLTRDVPFETDAEFKEFREKWRQTYSDPHVPPLLEGITKYQQIGISMKDAQLLESRVFSIPEICRWFGVSPTLVFDLSKANYNSLEQLIRSFINFTLQGWIDRWNGDFWRCVLTPEEQRQDIFPMYSLAHIEKGDFQARMSGYGQALVNGVFSRNEVREKEGMEPKPGLDGYTVQIQNVPVASVAPGTIQTPDDGALAAAAD